MTLMHLLPGFFTEKERAFVDAKHGLSASLFRFESGVEAVRLKNAVGELVMLPFQGQQIWNAVMRGRTLTMRSMFSQPQANVPYLQSYGAFFLHCGFTAIGPAIAPTDDYPLHGELPQARYQRAHIALGEDARGPFIALGGGYQHTIAFACNYLAEPCVKLYADSSLFEISMRVTNLKRSAQEYMYLGHINFRPVNGGRLVYSAHVTPQTVRVRTSIPPHIAAKPGYRELLNILAVQPELHHTFSAELQYDPEAVFSIDYLADAHGHGHTLHVLPDGSGDYVRHRVDVLDKVLRWLSRTPDQDALGMAEVATAEVEGFAAEKAKGNVKTLEAGAVWNAVMDVGALSAAETQSKEREIVQIVTRQRG
jgi:hypothetical protein